VIKHVENFSGDFTFASFDFLHDAGSRWFWCTCTFLKWFYQSEGQ